MNSCKYTYTCTYTTSIATDRGAWVEFFDAGVVEVVARDGSLFCFLFPAIGSGSGIVVYRRNDSDGKPKNFHACFDLAHDTYRNLGLLRNSARQPARDGYVFPIE